MRGHSKHLSQADHGPHLRAGLPPAGGRHVQRQRGQIIRHRQWYIGPYRSPNGSPCGKAVWLGYAIGFPPRELGIPTLTVLPAGRGFERWRADRERRRQDAVPQARDSRSRWGVGDGWGWRTLSPVLLAARIRQHRAHERTK